MAAARAARLALVAVTLPIALAGCAGDDDEPAVTGSIPVAGAPATAGPPGTSVVTLPPAPPAPRPDGVRVPVGAPNPIVIRGDVFDPPTLEVEAGATVTWVNGDEGPHWVLSRRPEVIDSGSLEGGNSFATVFDTPGTYEYFCNVVDGMEGVVVVR
jgi:plastocyanin